MRKRKLMMLSAAIVALLLLSVSCTPRQPTPRDGKEPELLLTLEQLKQYDGKNGRPAYVAIDGTIYDVSKVSAWGGGMHQGFTAGQELTEILKNRSPHGVRVLRNLKVVGKLK